MPKIHESNDKNNKKNNNIMTSAKKFMNLWAGEFPGEDKA